jgi:hypothetical protein
MEETSDQKSTCEKEVANFCDPSSAYKPASTDEAMEVIKAYSERLTFLWEQYLKVVQLNIVLSGATIGLIANMTFLRDKTDGLVELQWLQFSLWFACASGLSSLIWRFCAQVQMERQVYGNIKLANWYFDLNGSTKPEGLSYHFNSYEKATNCLKLVSGSLLLISWAMLSIFAYVNLESLKDSVTKSAGM